MREPGTIEQGVLFGHRGQLFLTDGGHDVLGFCLRQRSVAPESIQNFAANIELRTQFAAAHRASFCHVVFPDKQSVLTEDFPLGAPHCLGEEYLARMPGLADRVIYPREVLRRATGPVYLQTDTHMSDLGTVLVAAEVARRVISPEIDGLVTGLIQQLTIESDWSGDLGQRFSPPMGERRKGYSGFSPLWYHNNLGGGANNGIVDIRINPLAPHRKRILIMGDSFGRELGRYLAYFVHEVTFLRTPFFHPEIFTQIAPDVLLTENVERYFSWCALDQERPPFMLYPHLHGQDYKPDQSFVEAFSAVLSYPRRPYLDFMAKIMNG